MKRIALLLLLGGCAAAPPMAPTARVTSVGGESRVCLDRAAVSAGQTLRFHRRVCEYVPPKNLVRQCRDEPIESAEVVRPVDDHCMIVMSPAPLQLQPGDELEIAAR